MKIVRVIARLNVGGPARHVVWLTAALNSGAYRSLLVAGSVPEGEEDMSYFAAEMGVAPVAIPEMSREISLRDAVTIWKLYRLFRRERPDIVHTHTAKAGTVGRVAGLLYRWSTLTTLLGRPRKCRFVHTYHGHIFHSYYGRTMTSLFLGIERLLARLATDRILVLSEQQRREIHEDFGVGRASQFRIVPLGLDTSVFAGGAARRSLFRDELGACETDVLVGIVGRLTAIKNHELFLRAAACYKKQHSSRVGKRVRFVVIGDGQLREELVACAEANGLGEDVVFMGSRRDPENFYPALDVVALTSRNEGTPLTLLEAMANARAVVATAVGGVVDLVGAGEGTDAAGFQICSRGIRVRPSDAEAFAAALAAAIEDAEWRQTAGARGREFVNQHYTRKRLCADVTALYAELVPGERAARAEQISDRRLESGA
jgi:glycosyltransferase involved in cell wall biosynthesis